jgi:RimJ/RimL family protein N-acetyltransferase
MKNSNRLRFELLCEENKNWIFDLYNRPENIEFLEGIDAAQDIQLSIDCSKKYGIGAYLVFEKDSDDFVGVGGIQMQEPLNDGTYAISNHEIEFLIMLNPEFKGQGYASELCRVFFSEFFNKFPDLHIPARVNQNNLSCIKLLKKFGFSVVSEISYHKPENKFSLLLNNMNSWSKNI